ncbi:hypothetical protein AAMO2058_000479300, partial [Amorphochlora amoebiformis]
NRHELKIIIRNLMTQNVMQTSLYNTIFQQNVQNNNVKPSVVAINTLPAMSTFGLPSSLPLESETLLWNTDDIDLALSSPIYNLDGKVSMSTPNWKGWNSTTERENDVKCVNGRRYLGTFQSGIAKCAAINSCWGVSVWIGKKESLSDFFHDSFNQIQRWVYLCTDSEKETETEGQWLTLYKPIPEAFGWNEPTEWNASNHLSYKISFQPKPSVFQGVTVDITLHSDWNKDTGLAYSKQNGLSYGWKCKQHLSFHSDKYRPINARKLGIWTGKVPWESWQKPCGDNTLNEWNIAVPNAVYVVTLYVGEGPHNGMGCSIEGSSVSLSSENPGTKIVTVQVMDGNLTLSSYNDPGVICSDIHWIVIDRLQDSFSDVWVPNSGSKEAWWQLKLEKPTEIGVISIYLPQVPAMHHRGKNVKFRPSCEQRWLYEQGNWCGQDRMYSLGKNEHKPALYQAVHKNSPPSLVGKSPHLVWGKMPKAGGIVSLSNKTCDNQGCEDPNEQICGAITEVQHCLTPKHRSSLCPIHVDCK